MSEAVMTYKDEDYGIEFRWHGGAYIDVGYTTSVPLDGGGMPITSSVYGRPTHQVAHEAGEFVATECINVWDYAEDVPTIERSLSAFEEKCREWLSRDEDEEDEDE